MPRVTFHSTFATALAAARAERYEVGAEEHCWRPAAAPSRTAYTAGARLLEVADRGGTVELRYRAPGPAFLTAANTFDPGWRARVDGAAVAVYPTAICQLGIELPAGEHRLRLDYRDERVAQGAWISGAALALWAVLFWAVKPAAGDAL